MSTQAADSFDQRDRLDPAHRSGVSWGAILIGAVSAAALALILISLGVGLGFAAVSPWAGHGASATAITIGGALWLFATQIITSGMGGYITGRLRVRWPGTHNDEVFFRDTAHGLAAWAVAAIVGASVVASGATSLLGSAASATAQVGGAAVGAAGAGAAGAATAQPDAKMPNDYVADVLLRDQKPDQGARDAAPEIGRILSTSLANGAVSADDRAYLAKLVAQRTGIDSAQAEQRVNDVLGKASAAWEKAKQDAKEAADAARKSAVSLALWIFISLLGGAFFASLMATFGGRLRDKI